MWYIHDDQSALGTDPYIVITDTSGPAVNDYDTAPNGGAPKFLKVGMVTATAGEIYVAGYLWWDNATQTGYGKWFQQYIATYDDADFAYDFRGGEETMILASRRASDWDYVVVDDVVGDTNLLEAATAVGTVQSGVSAGSSVVLQLDTGEAANFTADKYYFLFDFDGHSWCNYVKVESVDAGTDQITVDNINHDFPSGAVISSYAHRYYVYGTGNRNVTDWSCYGCSMPYYSEYGNEMEASGMLMGRTGFEYLSNILNRGDPEDEGYYYCMRPVLYEYHIPNYSSYNDGSSNRSYGVAKNIYVSADTGLSQMLDYRTISSVDWLCLVTAVGSHFAYLIRNTEATS